MINKTITITELSTLTGKSRPTLYKYYAYYSNNVFDDIPFSIKTLFDIACKKDADKKEIINYCNKTFKNIDDDIDISEIITLIKNNKEKIDLKMLKKAIKEGIKNG